MLKVVLFATAATAALTCAGAAAAQANRQAPDAVEEVIVTAQRRAESLQSVPISITALTGKQLAAAGVATTQDLTTVTPGLVWARSSFNSQPTIRGIGNRNAGPGDEPNVATFIDGVYIPQQSATLQELTDIDRVEVLKGPQGTLFGRNATGGAVNIITRRPSFTPTGDLSVTAGRFGYRRASAYVSGPLVESKLAGSLSAVALDDDGYIHNVVLNTTQGWRETVVARGSLMFTPTENIEFSLNALYSNSRDNISYSGHALNGNTQARRTANPTNIPPNILIPQGDFETATQFEPYDKVRLSMVDAHMRADLGWATLTGLLSSATARIHTNSDTDISPLTINRGELFLDDRWTNEGLVLTDNGAGRLHWLVGADAFQANSVQNPNISNGVANYNGQRTSSTSLFGEVTYEIVDHLFLTGGLRYTRDTKKSFNRPGLTGATTNGSHTWSRSTPRVVLRYEFNPDANVYASYTEGYKSGTFNPITVGGAQTPAAPEQVKAYEIGAKLRVVPSIRLTMAAFHYDYTNLQTTVINTVNGLVVSSLQNAPAAEINGFESTLDWRATDNFNLTAGLSVLRAEVTDFPNASVVTPILVNGLPAGNSSLVRDVAGKDLIRAPRSTLNVGANYHHDLWGGTLTLTGAAFFSDRYFIELTNRVEQPRFTLVNASATWTAPSGNWRATVFGQNLTDARINASMISTTFNDNISYQKPRWFGLTLGYSF